MSVFNIETAPSGCLFFYDELLLSLIHILIRESDRMKKIGMIGGDLRNRYFAEMLTEEGYEVSTYGLTDEENELSDVVKRSDYIISGIPFSQDNRMIQAPFLKKEISIEEVFSLLSKEKTFFAGSMKPEIKERFKDSEIRYYDFLEDERTTIMNVIPTVEGAIEFAIRNTDFTLFDSDILILGYGRIGKYLGRVLKALGAKVSVAARKESDLSWVSLEGNQALSYEQLNAVLNQFDVIFNTVPALVLKEEQIRLLKKSCFIIDLASKPGGVDFESAKKYGIEANLVLGLPGKTAPKSAAKYMFEFFEKCTK